MSASDCHHPRQEMDGEDTTSETYKRMDKLLEEDPLECLMQITRASAIVAIAQRKKIEQLEHMLKMQSMANWVTGTRLSILEENMNAAKTAGLSQISGCLALTSYVKEVDERLKRLEEKNGISTFGTFAEVEERRKRENEEKSAEPGQSVPPKITKRTIIACGGCGDVGFKDMDAYLEHDCLIRPKASVSPLPQKTGEEKGEGGAYFTYPAQFSPTTDLPTGGSNVL